MYAIRSYYAVLDPFVGVFKGNSQNIEIRKEGDKYVFVQFSLLTNVITSYSIHYTKLYDGGRTGERS